MQNGQLSHPSEHALRWNTLKEKGREDAKIKREDRFLMIDGCHCRLCYSFYLAGWDEGVKDLLPEAGKHE